MGVSDGGKTTRGKPRKRVGRPPEKPPPKMAARILEWIADGQTLASFCRKRGAPASRTVEHWKDKDEVFMAAYAHARAIGGTVIAERMRDTAAKRDSKRQDDVQHRRLIIDTDKWLLARWFPTNYGDRVAVSGAEGAPPIQLSNADAAREVALLLATAAARRVAAQRKIEMIEENGGDGADSRESVHLTPDNQP